MNLAVFDEVILRYFVLEFSLRYEEIMHSMLLPRTRFTSRVGDT